MQDDDSYSQHVVREAGPPLNKTRAILAHDQRVRHSLFGWHFLIGDEIQNPSLV